MELASRWLGGRRFYRRRWLSAGRFVVRREDVLVPDLPPELEGFTIAQLSDFHAGPFLRAGDLADVVAAVARAEPDLVALTGDYITHHWSEGLLLLDDLARLSPPAGIFAVFGNHDYRGRQEGRLEAAYAERGVRFLRNAAVRLPGGEARLALVGLEDLEEGRVVDLERARSGLAPGDVEVVLCHNPLGAVELARPGCVLVLAGHTHGGQVDLPFLRRLGPRHPGLRVDLGPTTLLVSRGLGVVGVPLRWGAPAEVVLARLCRGTRCTAA